MVGLRLQMLGLVLIGSFAQLSAPALAGDKSQFDWTGFYVGGNAGYAWGNADFGLDPTGNWANFPADAASLRAATNRTLEPEGFIGGGQIGYNNQIGIWLVGLEADIAAMDARDSIGGAVAGTGITTRTQQAELSWVATIRGRLGFTVERALVYATGGVAFADWDLDMYMEGAGDEARFRASSVRTGWVVGGGMEFALATAWSLKGEYLYADFGDVSGTSEFSGGGIGFTQNHDIDLSAHLASAGINYRF